MANKDDMPKRIVARRAELGWSQSKLAQLAHVAPAQVSRYESGKSKPSAQVLSRLADAMAVSFDWLLTGNDESGFENIKDDSVVSMSIELDQESSRLLAALKKEHGVSDDTIIKAALLTFKALKQAT